MLKLSTLGTKIRALNRLHILFVLRRVFNLPELNSVYLYEAVTLVPDGIGPQLKRPN